MRRIYAIALGIFIGITAVGCNKIKKYNQLDLLIDKEWRLTSILENGEELADSCQLDNTMLFSKSGEMSYNFGVVNCEEEYEFDEWKFKKEFSELRFKGTTKGNGAGFASYFERRELVQLTDSILVLKETYPAEVQGMPMVFKYTVN